MSYDDEGHWDGTHPEDVMARGPVMDPEDELFREQRVEWCLVIEETSRNFNDARAWSMTGWMPCKSRGAALEEAYLKAKTYEPEHPSSPQGRTIYQIGEDTWLVVVPGATTTFHFRVSVARFVAELDRDGNPV